MANFSNLITVYLLRSGDVIKNRIDGLLRFIPRHGILYVGKELLVAFLHLFILAL